VCSLVKKKKPAKPKGEQGGAAQAGAGQAQGGQGTAGGKKKKKGGKQQQGADPLQLAGRAWCGCMGACSLCSRL
jgi:hypothetical protein